MKLIQYFVVLIAFVLSAPVAARKTPDTLCTSLKAFVESVHPGESHEFTFHTIWGRNFNDSLELSLFAKRCEHNEYTPAMAVCEYFMENGRAEFSEDNFKRVLVCLSPKTHFGGAVLERGRISLGYDSTKGWSDITVDFSEDTKLGGMALQIAVESY